MSAYPLYYGKKLTECIVITEDIAAHVVITTDGSYDRHYIAEVIIGSVTAHVIIIANRLQSSYT